MTPRPQWRKSSRSQQNGSCVEVADLDGVIGIRDTKQHEGGPTLIASAEDWRAFVAAVTANHLT